MLIVMGCVGQRFADGDGMAAAVMVLWGTLLVSALVLKLLGPTLASMLLVPKTSVKMVANFIAYVLRGETL